MIQEKVSSPGSDSCDEDPVGVTRATADRSEEAGWATSGPRLNASFVWSRVDQARPPSLLALCAQGVGGHILECSSLVSRRRVRVDVEVEIGMDTIHLRCG